jgi:hypothetical protein
MIVGVLVIVWVLVLRNLYQKKLMDGYDWSPCFKGEAQEGPRKEFLYWTDDGDLAGLLRLRLPEINTRLAQNPS